MSTSRTSLCIPRKLAKTLFSSIGMVLLLGGCSWLPFGSDKDKADAGAADAAPELDHCTQKLSACRNSCLDLGAGCAACCRRNAASCDRGEGYKFFSCPDE